MATYTEEDLDKDLLNNDKERKIIDTPGDSQWGQLILPGKDESSPKTKQGLKLLVIASYRTGNLLVKSLIHYENIFPEKLNIVGLITDDPVSKDAKISAKRRIWRLFDEEEKMEMEENIIQSSLSSGIPVFTGAVKTDFARSLLKRWNPDAIMVFVFGQIIDSPFINYPELGIYNFHPADLKHHHGAGPRPYVDLLQRNALTTRFTVHQLSEELDAGHVIGQSPEINIRNSDGSLTDNLLILEDKSTEPTDFLSVILANHLIKNHHQGKVGKIETLNFVSYFTKVHKELLKQPIRATKPMDHIPELSEFTLDFLSKQG